MQERSGLSDSSPCGYGRSGGVDDAQTFLEGSSDSNRVRIPFEAVNRTARNKCTARNLAPCVKNLRFSSSRDACVSSRLQLKVRIVRNESCRTPPTNGSQLRCDDGEIHWRNSSRTSVGCFFPNGIGKYGKWPVCTSSHLIMYNQKIREPSGRRTMAV